LRYISEFPFRDGSGRSSLHEHLLLLEMNDMLVSQFALGYYDMFKDVFHVCESGHIGTEGFSYEERILEWHDSTFACAMPTELMLTVGRGRIRRWLPLDDALDSMQQVGCMEEDVEKVLRNTGYMVPFLICMDSRKLTLARTGSFTGIGKQFGAVMPIKVGDGMRHMNSAVSPDRIRFVVQLPQWQKEHVKSFKPRKVTVDGLLDRLRGANLSRLDPNGAMSRLEDIILEQLKEEEADG
jgi:hypothetical protein